MPKYRLDVWPAFPDEPRREQAHPEQQIKALAPDAFNLVPESLFDCWTFETLKPIAVLPRWVCTLESVELPTRSRGELVFDGARIAPWPPPPGAGIRIAQPAFGGALDHRLPMQRGEPTPPRALRPRSRVAYGFIATVAEQIPRDSSWSILTTGVFRPQSFVVWEPGERFGVRRFERAVIESLTISADEQLQGPVPAVVFTPAEITPEQFLANWLVMGRLKPERCDLHVFCGERVKAFPGGFGALMRTAEIGVRMSIRFKGALLGALLVGEQLDAPDSAPPADQSKHEG